MKATDIKEITKKYSKEIDKAILEARKEMAEKILQSVNETLKELNLYISFRIEGLNNKGFSICCDYPGEMVKEDEE